MSGLDFALNFLARMQVEEYYPLHNLWTDDAHYHLDSAVNAQTCCIWGSTNPHSVQQQPLHSPYVMVWCGFTSIFVLGLYSFKDVTMNRFVRCRVTNAWHRRLLEDHVVLALRQKKLFGHHSVHARWSNCSYGTLCKECYLSLLLRWMCHLVYFPNCLARKIARSEVLWLLAMGFSQK